MKRWLNRHKNIVKIILCTFLILLVTNPCTVNMKNFKKKEAKSVNAELSQFSDYTLSSNERVVNSYAELKDALSNNNGVTTVYFGNNIEIQNTGIKIHSSKVNITIIGLNPLDPTQAEPYTLTDYNSEVAGVITDTIYISTSGPTSLLIRDIKIIGKNYYGPFSVYDSDSLSNLVVTYERVMYDGPQIGYHRKGLIRFIDCSVKIHGRNGGSQNQEFSEAKYLEFEGKNSIYTETTTHSIFWIPYGGSLKIENSSSLSLVSPSTSTAYGIFYADSLSNNIDIIVGEFADIDITISGVTAVYAGISSLTVQEGGSFLLNTTKSTSDVILPMSGNLTVDKDATFVINAYGSSGKAVINQKAGNIYINKDATFHIIASAAFPYLINLQGKSLICDDPVSVLLYNNNRDISASISQGRIYINAEQINYWKTLSGGGLDEPPLYCWEKKDKSNFWIDGLLSIGTNGNFKSLSSNYTEGIVPDLKMNEETFNMANARVISFGRPELVVTTPVANATSVSGVTAPGATVRVSFSQNGVDYTLNDITADSEGIFHFDTGLPLNVFTTITVKSNYKYLTATEEIIVNGSGTLEFNVPKTIDFLNSKISITETFIKRANPDWHIVVSDTRGAGNEWSVYVSLLQPLTPLDDTKPVLKNALVFANNSTTPLTEDKLLIYHHVSESDNEVTKIHWAAEKGILINVPINIAYSEVPYTAIIKWSLIDAP